MKYRIHFKMLLLFGIVLFNSSFYLNGQELDPNYLYHVPSPQTSDFLRYGNLPVNYYTGNLNIEIPIYKYEDKDFNIDMSLRYNSSGFIPNKRSSIVGLNWFLDAGGVITRKVKGVPDDTRGDFNGFPGTPLLHGLLYGLKESSNNYSSDDIYSFSEGFESSYHRIWSLNSAAPFETESDEYTFNFMGIRGKFMIGFDGKAVVYSTNSAGTYNIDISKMGKQEAGRKYPNYSQIKITTGNGYVYEFGGTPKNLEYLTGNPSASPITEAGIYFNPTVVSWYLTKITAPNGRQVSFEYLDFDPSYDYGIPNDPNFYLFSKYPQSTTKSYSNYISLSYFLGDLEMSESGGYSNSDPTLEALKTVYLSKVVIDNHTIELFYSDKEKKFYQEYSNRYNRNNNKLDSIYISTSSEPIKKAYLNYSYKGDINKERLFLDEVKLSGQNSYLLDYLAFNLPSPETQSIDYWGFWNGEDDKNADLIPRFSYNTDGDITYLSPEREPKSVSGVFNQGLLKKVTYPTGGYTKIEYEPHDYSYRLERKSDNDFMPMLYHINKLSAGGARVKKLSDYDERGNLSGNREFYYTTNFSPSNPNEGSSSGILLRWPRFLYAISGDFFPGRSGSYYNSLTIRSVGVSVGLSENEYITYSDVIEKRDDGSYITYRYSSYRTNPDDTNQNSKLLSGVYDAEPMSFYNNIYRKTNDRSFERGLLIRKEFFNADNNAILVNSYGYQVVGGEEYVPSVIQSGNYLYAIRNYTNSYLLKTDTIDTYYGNNKVRMIHSYEYNDYGQISKKKTANSVGNDVVTKYLYPIEINNGIYGDMVTNNILSPIIEETKFIGGSVVSSNLTTYMVHNNMYVPMELYNLKTSTGNEQFRPFDGEEKDEKYEIPSVIFEQYDSKGNLLEYMPQNGILHSFYIINDYSKYPIIEAKNIRYSELSSAIDDITLNSGMSIVNQYNADNYISSGDIKNIVSSLNQSYPDCIFEGSTYKPLIGLTSRTDPGERITSYTYNEFGQLEYIRDNENNILSKRDYHYYNAPILGERFLSFSFLGKPKSFTISTDNGWNITKQELSDWLSISPSSGNGNTTITVNPSLNTTDSDRSESIHITYDTGVVQEVSVYQGEMPSLYLEISAAQVKMDEYIDFELYSSTSWEIIKDNSLSWLIVSDEEGGATVSSGVGSMTLYLTADPIASSYERGNIRFVPGDGTKEKTIAISF
nr:BACON domain-containing protein [uncultured Draconibacterium sp.]